MLVKVSLDEISRNKRLEYDLYSPGGKPLYRAGYALSDDELNRLDGQLLYRSNLDMPKDVSLVQADESSIEYFDHEGVLIPIGSPLTDSERYERIIEEAQPDIYEEGLAHSFITSVQYFWQRMGQGASPDIALCEVVTEKLISEVTSHVDQIHYLSQVRVRDKFTYSHILDVTALSIALAIKAGFSKSEIKDIALAAILHDMGKLLIPKSIMFKPSRLTEKEFRVMKLHPELGYKIIRDEMKLPEHIARPALEHQEMYGGGGYPLNIKGDQIHPYSHVIKIADVYDALTSKRPYKESIPSSKAIKIMLSEGEKSFHPEFLKHFVELSNYADHAKDGSIPRAS